MTFKIEASMEGAHIIVQPMVRNFSTGGGPCHMRAPGPRPRVG